MKRQIINYICIILSVVIILTIVLSLFSIKRAENEMKSELSTLYTEYDLYIEGVRSLPMNNIPERLRIIASSDTFDEQLTDAMTLRLADSETVDSIFVSFNNVNAYIVSLQKRYESALHEDEWRIWRNLTVEKAINVGISETLLESKAAEYDILLSSFPVSWVAKLFGYHKYQ